MTFCSLCNNDSSRSIRCVDDPVLTLTGVYPSVPFGRETVTSIVAPYCVDCLTPRKGFHHEGCSVEQCPACGDQRLYCACDEDADEHAEEDHLDLCLSADVVAELFATLRTRDLNPHDAAVMERFLNPASPPSAVHVCLIAMPEHKGKWSLKYPEARPHWTEESLRELASVVGSPEDLQTLNADPLPTEEFDWAAVPDGQVEQVTEVLEAIDRMCASWLFKFRTDADEFRTACRRFLLVALNCHAKVTRVGVDPRRIALGVMWAIGKGNNMIGRGYSEFTVNRMEDAIGLRSAAATGAALVKAVGCPWAISYTNRFALGNHRWMTAKRRAGVIRDRDLYRQEAARNHG
jgi:hypothetical protein